jgi:hypothetical protein
VGQSEAGLAAGVAEHVVRGEDQQDFQPLQRTTLPRYSRPADGFTSRARTVRGPKQPERGYRVVANSRTLLYLESAPMVNGENIRIDGGAHAGAKW